MHSISSVARQSGLPRRVAQYWHDKEAIVPLNRKPVVYSDDELLVVRLLSTLAPLGPNIDVVKEMARIFRLCLEGDESVPEGVAEAFKLAREGKAAFLCIAPETMSDGKSIWTWTYGADGEKALCEVVTEHSKSRPNLALTVIDLQYCLDLSKQVGVIMVDDGA